MNDPDLLEPIRDYVPLGWGIADKEKVDFLYSMYLNRASSHRGRRLYNLLYAGSGRVARSVEIEKIYTQFEAHAQLTTAFLAKDYLFVHAGVVGWQGKAIVIPGRSFTGKSTLVKALVDAGATYYSDEFMVVDTEGKVHPYLLPLSLRDQAGQKMQPLLPTTLNGNVGQMPLPVGLILVTKYSAGASWRPRLLSPAETVLALMDHTISARRNPEFALPVLQKVVSTATTVKTRRGNAPSVVNEILNRLIM